MLELHLVRLPEVWGVVALRSASELGILQESELQSELGILQESELASE
jgi:hypothetical protein